MNATKPKFGIALSGGGARGIAHVGVLQALVEAGIEPEIVAGTSAGAIFGSLYAAGVEPKDMLRLTKQGQFYKAFMTSLPNLGFADLGYLRKLIEPCFKRDDFDSLEKPLTIAISNIYTGELELRQSGPLLDVICASSAIPLVFKPVQIDGQMYVDGGVFNNLPAVAIKGKCETLIGVNVHPFQQADNKKLRSSLQLALRIFDLSVWNNTRDGLELCDLVITPSDCKEYNMFDFRKVKEIYQVGYEAGQVQVEQLKSLLSDVPPLK